MGPETQTTARSKANDKDDSEERRRLRKKDERERLQCIIEIRGRIKAEEKAKLRKPSDSEFRRRKTNSSGQGGPDGPDQFSQDPGQIITTRTTWCRWLKI